MNLFKTGEFERVIADINMPKMDGIEMVKPIRELNKDVEIVAISMMADSVSIKKMLKAGANR
ncbi:MAG: YesN/AraC family two-component response regulator [Cyclobacteriaceae bacterium]